MQLLKKLKKVISHEETTWMNYLTSIVVSSSAKKNIKKMDKKTKQRILDAMENLRYIPPEGDIRTLKGKKGFLRCRVGDWRIIFKQNLEDEIGRASCGEKERIE